MIAGNSKINPYSLPVMNLGELIVDLSLDYTEFTQSLEKAKRAAANAASAIEKSFDKVSLTIEVDDSALYDLNKHLDLKYKHFKEVNNYFKNNPLTPTVDDEQLTQLNETLHELTRSNHVVNIQQNLDIKVKDSSKREISQTVADAIEEGVLNAIDKVADKIEDAISNAVSKGTKAGGGSSGGSSKDVVDELKAGFGDIRGAIGDQLIGDALKTILKPGKDLLTGFFEGVSNSFGNRFAKGIQDSLKKNSDVNLDNVGEKAADSFLKAFGVKIKAKKGKSGGQDLGQEIIKDVIKSVASGSVENIISTGVKVAVEAAKNAVTTELTPLAPIPLPPARQKQRQRELEPVPLNAPQQTQQRVNRIAVDTPELKTPFAKAQEQSRDFSYSLEDVVKSKFTGANLKELTEKITKIKTTHQALQKTLLNLMKKARTSGDFRAVEAIYLGYQTDGKKAIDEINRLVAEMKAGGATQEQINSISQAKSPISRATGKSSKLSQLYQRSKREAEKAEFVGDAAVGIGLDVIAGLKEGVGNGQFAKIATENALAYLTAIKKTFGIQSPSKVMMQVGLFIIQGLQQGLNGNIQGVVKSTDSIKRVLTKAFSGFMSGTGFNIPGLSGILNIKSMVLPLLRQFIGAKGIVNQVIDSLKVGFGQASSTGDNRLGDYLKNFTVTFIEDFLKKQKVTGSKGDAIKNILGAAFGGNKLGFTGAIAKTFLSYLNPLAAFTGNFNPVGTILKQAIGNKGIGGVAKMALPLLAPIAGIAATRAGNFVSNAITNNNAVKPGLINDLINSLTGINLATPTRKLPEMLKSFLGMFGGFNDALEKMGVFSLGNSASLGALGTFAPFISMFASGGRALANSRVSNSGVARVSPGEVIRNQIATNINSLGIAPGEGIKGLITQIGKTLADSLTFKNMNLSPQLRGVIEKNKGIVDGIVNGAISGILNLSIFANKQSGILGKVIGAADAYGSGNVQGAISKGTAAVKGITQTIGLKIDTSQIKVAMTALLLGISAFHKAFTEEGLNIGKSLIKGFKEAQSNWVSVRNDVRRGIQKAIGAESLKDTWNDIAHEWGKGIVSVARFEELFDVMGSTFRKRMLSFMSPDDREGMQGNILSFIASLSTAFAPVATFASTLIPLFAPLLPLFGAIGGAAMMVGKHIQGVVAAIKEIEPLQRRLEFLGGSKEGGRQEMAYALGTADKLNVPVKEGVQAYSQLAIAARHTKLEGDGVRELYEGISSSLSALGISGADASLVFIAYTQILSKGKVSMEELRQQLGEKFPPAMGVFAKALGVSIAELGSLVSKGALLSEDVLPKVAKVLQQDYGNAASGAQGLTVALTRLGNVGFKVAIKLTDTFGGMFAGVVNMAASALGVFEKAMDELLKLAGSLVIGVTAVIGVGLATILGMPAINKHIMNVSNLFVAGLKSMMVGLAPYYLGIVTDVADGWLGAQNDLISNMTNGVSNIFIAIFGFLDTQKRLLSDTGKGMFGEMIGELNQVNFIADVFNQIKDSVVGFFQSIPPGLVEIGAMLLMFRQVQVLAQSFLNPTLAGAFKGLAQIAGNFGGMIQSAFTKNSIKDLFGGTFGAIDVANTFSPSSAQPSLASQLKTEFSELGQQVKSFGKEKWSNFRAGIDSARQSISNLSWQGFKDNVKNAADSVRNFGGNVWQGFTTGVTRARDAVASALTPFTALFSSNGAIRSAARADWANAIAAGFGKVKMALAALKPLLIEIGIALALFMLSRSDFSNPIQGSINKMTKSMNDAFRSMDKSFASLGNNLDKTTEKLQILVNNLPSKGLELNLGYALGMGGESLKSDDVTKAYNSGNLDSLPWYAQPAFGLPWKQAKLNDIREANKEKVQEAAKLAREFGIGDQITGNEVNLTIGQEQLLGQFKSLKGNTAAFKEQATSRGLTRATVGNLMQGDTLETVKQVRQVEKELYELGKKRAELARQNTSESRNKISELDKQLFALEDKRAKLVKPLIAVDEDVKSFQKSVEDMTKAIEESDNPPDVKRKLKAMLEPMQEMAKEASEIVAENLPVKPLEDVYQNTINALKDFELAYERFGKDLEKASLGRQEALFTSGATQGNIQFGTRAEQIDTDTSRLNALKESVQITDKALKNLETIPGIERTEERANEIKELRKKLQEGELGVQQLSTSIARNRYELQQELVRQTKQVADYYRGAVREAEFVGLEFEKASRNLKNTQLQTKLKQALIGAGDNLYTQFIENIINIIQQTSADVENAQIESQRQQLEYRNNVEDIQLQASELARSLPGEIIPFDQSVVIDFDNALKAIDGTVNTINSSVDKVENSLGVDIVEAAKKANDALQSIDRKIAEIESSSNQWTNSLTSGFNNFIANFQNGWQGIGQAIADVAGQSTNLIATLSSGTGIVGAIATGVQAANQGQFGSGVQQEVQSAVQNPIGWLKNQAQKSITASGSFVSPIAGTTVDQLLKYKPSFGQSFYGVRDGGARRHSKIDFDSRAKAGQGAEILASLPGVATSKKWTGNSGGVFVNSLLPSGQKITLEYGHLSLESIKAALGGIGKEVHVQAGQRLGKVTMDALSSGPHLDFGVRINGKYTDPQKFMRDFMAGKYGSTNPATQAQAAQQTRQYQPVPKVPALPGGITRGGNELTQAEYSKLTSLGKKLYDLRENKNIRAVADAVARAEGTDFNSRSKNFGYGMLIGGENITNFSGHPFVEGRRGYRHNSSASGRYQMMDFNYSRSRARRMNRNWRPDMADIVNLGSADNPGSFSPGMQDLYFKYSLYKRGVLDDVLKGNIGPNVWNKLAPHYASIQSGGARSAYRGQGTPQGRHANLNSFVNQRLSQIEMQGGSIPPNQMQQAVAQQAQIRTNTAAQQFHVNQINSGTSQANLALREASRDLEISKSITSQKNTNFNEAKRLAESSLNFDQELFNSLNPNQSDRQKFVQELQRRKLKLETDIAEQQRIIDFTSPTIAKGIDLQNVFNEAKSSYLRSGTNESRSKELAQQFTVEAEKAFSLTKQANDNAVKQKAALEAQRDNIIKTMQSDFETKEQLRLDEQSLRITEDQIQLLQKELDLVRQLEQSNPLDPVVKTIPEIERNIANLNLQKETVSNLIQLDREFITGGGNMTEDVYKKRRDAILKANEAQQEINRTTYKHNKLINELGYESKQLAKSQLLMSSQMKALQLENDAFAIKNRIGLVDINGLTNELTIKVNELTFAYQQLNQETKNPSNALTPQERLTKQLRDTKNFQRERENLFRSNELDRQLAEQVTNPRAMLDVSTRRFNLLNQGRFDTRSAAIEGLRNSNANEFMVNRMIRELEVEKENERHRTAKEQLRIDVNQFNLDMEAMGFQDLMLTTEQIEKMSAALDELNQKNLDNISQSAQSFDLAVKKVFQENLINGLTTGITDLINGTKSLGETLNDLANNILNGVLNVALNSLFKGMFGGGGLFGGLFGLNKGGKVPNYADGGVIGAIGDALQRERQASGVKPVLAALTPGERVLTVQQNKRFEELQLEKVLNYSQGGVVGNAPKIFMPAPAQNSSININVPVNVQGNQNDASVNVPQLQNAVRNAVLTEIQKQQRPGGALNR